MLPQEDKEHDVTTTQLTAGRAPAEDILSPAEVDVMSRIARGDTNAQIAAESYRSINTIKTLIRSAYRKAGVTSRSQAVVWCYRHGLGERLDQPALASVVPFPRRATPVA